MSPTILQQETVLGPQSAGLRMTPAEFDEITEYDENFHYELVDGVIVVSPIPLPEERGPNELLSHFLWFYRQNLPQGESLDSTLPEEYVQTPNGRRIADRLNWAGLGRMPNPKEDLPSIAVEFVSGTKRDRQRNYVDKRAEYVALRIPEYWIFDRFERTLTVIQVAPEGTVREQVLDAKEMYESHLLPGFQLPIGNLLEAADNLAQAQIIPRKTKATRPKRSSKRKDK